MSDPLDKPTLEKWADGEIRADQIVYDKFLKQRVDAMGIWGKTWVKWLYDRDLSPSQAGLNLMHKVVVDYSAAAILEKKYPQVRTIPSYWALWTAYIYLKKPGEFHTLIFTGLDNSLRSLGKEHSPELENSELQSNPFVGLNEFNHEFPSKKD